MGLVAKDPVDKAELATMLKAGANPAAANTDVTGATPAGGTGATAGAYDTAGNRDILIATVAELKTKLNSLQAKLRTAGYLAP